MGTVETYILGQKYTIRGDAPDEHIQELISAVNRKIQEVCENTPNITPVKAAILAAISIADELHRLRSEQESLTRHIEEKAEALARLCE